MSKTNKKNELNGKIVRIGFADVELKEQAPQFKKSNRSAFAGTTGLGYSSHR